MELDSSCNIDLEFIRSLGMAHTIEIWIMFIFIKIDTG